MLHDLPGAHRAIHPAVCARIDRRDGLHDPRRAGRGTLVAPDHVLSGVSTPRNRAGEALDVIGATGE
jgi:hypothetical protein